MVVDRIAVVTVKVESIFTSTDTKVFGVRFISASKYRNERMLNLISLPKFATESNNASSGLILEVK